MIKPEPCCEASEVPFKIWGDGGAPEWFCWLDV